MGKCSGGGAGGALPGGYSLFWGSYQLRNYTPRFFFAMASFWICNVKSYSPLFSWMPKNSPLKSVISDEFFCISFTKIDKIIVLIGFKSKCGCIQLLFDLKYWLQIATQDLLRSIVVVVSRWGSAQGVGGHFQGGTPTENSLCIPRMRVARHST